MIDWAELAVTVGDRSVIYLETFPRLLDNALATASDPDAARGECDQIMLLQVLTTFAGAWGSLARMGEDRRVLFTGLAHGAISVGVLRFVAVELHPTQAVVADVTLLRPR